ncbi:amino acid ABC transporter permease [Desertihabitans aurantiacus]|uniref:amino acid ABC transporter permease n=1 Tax=Desertihabitans aurantiacus TaxID=2282477 RepID=UPI000DF7DC74|nr:amino acid ABC transporter permease [Desertihabitans aurantiacus]
MAEMLERADFLAAFWMTLRLAVLGTVGALLLGMVVAIMRVSPFTSLQFFARTYVTLIRNSPLTLILFFCVFGLQNSLGMRVGDDLSTQNLFWGVVAISVYHASFIAEALRSGVNTIPLGQAEAARAIGLPFGASLRHVIMPQAVRGAVAPVGNVIIALTKNTTVAATVGIAELASRMKTSIEFFPNLLYLIFVLVAVCFVVLTLPTGLFFTWLSRKVAVQR